MTSNSPSAVSSPPQSLTEFEQGVIRFFIELAQGFSLPKSVGEIFGLIFASAEPVAFDDVVTRLGISQGSASTGLRFLQRMGAVRTVYVARDRRSFYEPEMSLKRLFAGLINETIMPHLRSSTAHLEQLEDLLGAPADNDHTGHAVLLQRVQQLQHWRNKASAVLPLITKVTGVG